MPIENKFNLVDEPWIPVAGHGLASLSDIFSNPKLSALGGNPIQKIALMKLLLAIAQTAHTPKDDADWQRLGAEGMAKKSLEYLKDKKELFWLYGEKPFLQMPQIINVIKDDVREKNKEPKKIGNGDFPNLPNDNNTILLQSEAKENMSDADRALFILTLMSFALAGKQCHCNHMKPAIVGPSLGRACYLHSFLIVGNIYATLYLNLFSLDVLAGFKFFEEKFGVPPWEAMPNRGDCDMAQKFKKSYMSTLISMCRFVFLIDGGLFMTEGLQYENHQKRWVELSVAMNRRGDAVKVLQADIRKKPWRELTSLLSFIASQNTFDCPQLVHALNNAKKASFEEVRVWSGGLDVEGDAFGQKVSGEDDFVEAEVQLNVSVLGEVWFAHLKREMEELDKLSRIVYGATMGFFKRQKADRKKQAEQASNLFWQLCERKFQRLVDACADDSGEEEKKLRRDFAKLVEKAYNTYCPRDTARQLDAWAANKPILTKYLA